MLIVIIYIVVSFIIAVIDISALAAQEDYFNDVPIGDIGYYCDPKPILGVHNIIFFPSLFFIWVWKKIVYLFF